MVALALTLQLFGLPSPRPLHLAPTLTLAAGPELDPWVAGSMPTRAAPVPALDPYAGTSRSAEWALASLGVLTAEFASAVLLGAMLSGASRDTDGIPKASAGTVFVWLAATALAIPTGAALGAMLAANPEAGGSFGQAFVFSLLAELGGVAACAAAFVANPWLGLAVAVGWQFGVIPWAASRGMHSNARPESAASTANSGGWAPTALAWNI